MTNIVTLQHGACRSDLSLEAATLRAGAGVHLLAIELKARANWLEPDSHGSACMIVEGFAWAGSAMKPLASLGGRTVTLRGFFAGGSALQLVLADEQLLALEADRGDGDLCLVLDLVATLLGDSTTLSAFTTQVQYTIPRGRWLELLDGVGAQLAFTIRAPSPISKAVASPSLQGGEGLSLAHAGRRLREARHHLVEGRYEDSVAAARKALENIKGLVGASEIEKVRKVPARDRDQLQRWAVVHDALHALTSAAHHDDGTTRQFNWSRAEAEAVLVGIAGLLAVAARV